MEVTVAFGDELGHVISKQTWSSTVLSVGEGYLLQGDSLDWSNPDDGIWFHRVFAASDNGNIYSFLSEDGEDMRAGSVCVFDRDDMDQALSVSVDAQLVLERAPAGAEADFDCGLRWSVLGEAGFDDGGFGPVASSEPLEAEGEPFEE